MDNEIFKIFSSQEMVAAQRKKQTVAEQVMIDHLSRWELVVMSERNYSKSFHYIFFLIFSQSTGG